MTDINLAKEIQQVREDVLIMRESNNHRFEKISEVERKQNEYISQLETDTRTLLDDKIRRDGAWSVIKFFKDNFMSLLVILLLIFVAIDEERILNMIK